jgi:CheY-like chemotaxis protein
MPPLVHRCTSGRESAPLSADGGWVGYIGSVVDVTDVRRAQSEAFDKQRIESLRVLTNGIAHDFNNLLGTILAQADLAAGELADGSSPEEQIRTIAAITVRASEIVRQLMIYAGQDNSGFGPLDLSMLIEEMLGLLKASLSKHAVLKSALATDLPPVRGNAAQIRQVVMNLIINASEAIGERDGLIHVATSLARGGGTLSEGDYVRLEISDTGCGITDEQRSRIFDPFFSTKSKGHGLGLAVVEGIVRAHTGGIHLSSTPGRGSTFQILLPCIGSVQDLPSPTPDSIPNTNSAPATLLLVEDEEGLRYSISKSLSGRGYSVLTADNGSAAMDILRAHSGTIDAILLDMSIPGASSHEIIKEAELRRPEVKVVITSAYSRDVATSLLSSPIVKGFIRKPYQSVDLLQILQSTLNSE